MATFKQLLEVLKAYEDQLFNKTNVVGVGAGYKNTSNKEAQDLAIIVYVEKKVPESELSKEDIIPSTLSTDHSSIKVLTDVIESGNFSILKSFDIYRAPYNEKSRPIQAGYSIGSDTHTGTLGIMAWRYKDEKLYLVSNCHTLVDEDNNGIKIWQPSGPDGGDTYSTIAETAHWISLEKGKYNNADAAIGKLNHSINYRDDFPEIGEIYGHLKSISIGRELKKIGRTTGYSKGEVESAYVKVKVKGYGPTGTDTYNFKGTIVIGGKENIADKGDSGAVTVTENGYAATLIFGKSESGLVLSVPIDYIFRYWKLELREGMKREGNPLPIIDDEGVALANFRDPEVYPIKSVR